MLRCIFVISWFFILFAHAEEHEENKLSFALMHVPGIMEPNSTSAPYSKFLKHIIEQSTFPIASKFYPYNRAEKLMLSQKVDCLFPVVKGPELHEFPAIYSETINVVSVYLFSLQTQLKSFSDIPNKTVVYLDAYDFGHWNLDGKEYVDLVGVGTQESALKVLQSGRATAYMDYYPDLKLSLSKDAFSRLKFSKNHPISSFEDSVQCYTSEKNRAFILWLNQEIRTLKSNGKLRKLLEEYDNNH